MKLFDASKWLSCYYSIATGWMCITALALAILSRCKCVHLYFIYVHSVQIICDVAGWKIGENHGCYRSFDDLI